MNYLKNERKKPNVSEFSEYLNSCFSEEGSSHFISGLN